MYFAPLLKGLPLELGIGAAWGQKNDGAAGPRKKFDDVFSRLDTIHERDRQMDRWTDGHQATAKTALTHSVAP